MLPSLRKKWSFRLRVSSANLTNGKLHFLCSVLARVILEFLTIPWPCYICWSWQETGDINHVASESLQIAWSLSKCLPINLYLFYPKSENLKFSIERTPQLWTSLHYTKQFNTCLFKVNSRNTRNRCEIFSIFF